MFIYASKEVKIITKLQSKLIKYMLI